jgi:membrane complex biogenesis BtpA family protein
MVLESLFGRRRVLIGMIHAPALPGSPQNTLSADDILDFVLRDADALTDGGVDGLMIENFGDTPFYPDRVPPHTIAQMTLLAAAVKRRFSLPLGINVLRNDARAALAIAAATGAEYIRVNILTGARVTDQGLIQGRAHQVLRYREFLKAGTRIFADVAVKHSAPLGERLVADEVDDTVERGGADALIASGAGTGKQTPLDRLREIRAAAPGFPLLAGSGVTFDNIVETLAIADGAIVGTSLKRDGVSSNPVELARVRELVRAIK